MSVGYLNLFFRFAGRIFNLKQKLAAADGWLKALPIALVLIFAELIFAVISLPLYFSVSPKKIQQRGWIFPSEEQNAGRLHHYTVRRKIGLATFFSALAIFLIKVIFVGAVSFFLLGGQELLAATQDFVFTTPGNYTYDGAKIEITGGEARLKAISGTVSGGTYNSDFITSTAGWTYAQWQHGNNGANSGNYVASAGNPDAYADINLSVRKNLTEAGYWHQLFTTTANSPDTAALNLDWKSVTFGAQLPSTYRLYAFIETGSAAPASTSTAVWNSGEITTTTNWASIAPVDIKSKITATGTYYLKIGAYASRPNASPNNVIYVSGFDNVKVDWSKTVVSYATSSPTVVLNSSLDPAKPTTWDSFTETANKNGGEIYYQLSSDDGASWQYWDGTAWANAAAANYNTSTVVNAHIASFSTSTHKIKWKAFLSSDGTQQVSLSKISIGYTANTLPGAAITATTQAADLVSVGYNLTDVESDNCSLATYEYSLTGAFSGEQHAMTASTTAPTHNGVSGLSSSPSGVGHVFVWDALADLGPTSASTVYVRLRPNDGIGNGAYATSSVFSVDLAAPVVSNVTAVQSATSTPVYISYDLSENTADNLTTALEISADGGTSWTVPTASASGAIGPVTTGTAKAIVWPADSDYNGYQQSNMRVRVRATDNYGNQGAADSTDFSLDTLAPAAATQANLLAQPNAGDMAVLVGGSFTEANPGTNKFYVALNDGDYGAAVDGDSGTASPSALNLSVGAPLTGIDFVSRVKISHLDAHGLAGDNENNSPNPIYKFVKPYTPPAPTVDTPTTESVDITVNKNPAEADGLEYAIFESSQSGYVQNDGSLGSSPVWQKIGTDSGQWGESAESAGRITVTGLSDPVTQYIFQVKSHNISDSGHAESSESALSSGASSNYQSPSLTINSVSMASGTAYAIINYTGRDPQNAQNNLVVREYSLDGLNWNVMTEKSGVGSNGTTGLNFTAAGAALVFAWNAAADAPNAESPAVYVRLQSSDSITSSNLGVSSAFALDTAGPMISNIRASQASSTSVINIAYDLADGAGTSNTVELLVSGDGGLTYNITPTNISGDLGASVTAGADRAIVWNASADLGGQEKPNMRIKLRATDRYGNQGLYVESSDFAFDAKAPEISSFTAAQSATSTDVVVFYTLSENCSSVIFNVSSDGGGTWTVATNTFSGDIGASQTSGAKSFIWRAGVDFSGESVGNMRVRLRPTDYFGNVGSFYESLDFSLDTAAPIGLADLTKVVSDATSAKLGWAAATDSHFNHYELWTGALENDVLNRSGAAVKWSMADDAALGLAATNQTTITGLDLSAEKFVKIWAIDNFGNEASVSAISLPIYVPPTPTTTPTTTPPTPTTTPPVTPTAPEPSSGSARVLILESEISSTTTVVDLTPPSAPEILSPLNNAELSEDFPKFIGLAELSAVVKLILNKKELAETRADESGIWQIVLPDALSIGQSEFSFVAVDLAGNASQPTILTISRPAILVEQKIIEQPAAEQPAPSQTGPVPSAPSAAPAGRSVAPIALSAPAAPTVISQSQAAVETATLPPPVVNLVVAAPSDNVFSFSGTALPNEDVVVYIHSDEALIYSVKADAQGRWRVDHSQSILELAPGVHTVYAIGLAADGRLKSKPSLIGEFTVTKNFWVNAYQHLNLATTIVTTLVLLFTLFWLYRVRRRQMTSA